MRRYPLLLLALVLTSLGSFAQTDCAIPDVSRQVIVVLSPDWDSTVATMYRFERASAVSAWKPIGAVVPVNLGRTGLAWGRSELMAGAVFKPSDPHKKEGDGKAPAGLFPILKAFGHPQPPVGYDKSNLPFIFVRDHQCVDDVKSPYYNQIVRPTEVGGVSWSSAETMKIGLYQMGLVVGHNCGDAKAGLGSCIFFHRQSAPGAPTSGCTSMADGPLVNLLRWLKSEAKPVVLQLPRAQFDTIADPSWPRLPKVR